MAASLAAPDPYQLRSRRDLLSVSLTSVDQIGRGCCTSCPLIGLRIGMPVADTPMVRAAALPALSLTDVHTCSQGGQEQREPLRVRRPSKACHQVAVPNGPIRRRLD